MVCCPEPNANNQNLLLQPATPSEVAEGHPLGIPILKVADFGFARILPAAAMAETLCGSPLYMAPEILRYEKYDAKADLWSVGAVLFEMAVGRSPFRAPNHVELLRRIERGEDRIKFPDESSRVPTPGPDGAVPIPPIPVSSDIKTLIRGLLKQRPAERMNFDEFFAVGAGVWDGFMTESVGDVSTSMDVSTDSSAMMATAYSEKEASPVAVEAAVLPPSPPPPAFKRDLSADLSEPSTTAPTPTPTPLAVVRRSEPKYYVGDEPAEPDATVLPSPTAPTGIAGSTRAVSRPINTTPIVTSRRTSRAGGTLDDAPVVTPTGPIHGPRPVIGSSPLAATPPITMTGKDESALGASDSVGREYVVVEKRTVEINELADGECASGSSPCLEAADMSAELEHTARRPSIGGAVVPQLIKRNSVVSRPVSAFKPVGGSPPTLQAVVPTPSSYSPPFAFGSTPPFAVPAVRQAMVRTRQPSLPQTPTVFPPPGAYAISPDRHSSPSSLPSNALTRALTNTAVRLLNSAANTSATAIARATGSSNKRWPLVERSGEIDPDEGDILDLLEDTARKAFVLFDLADTRLFQWSQTVRPSATSATITPHTLAPSPGAPPFSIPPVGGRRKSSSSSTNSELIALRQQEDAAGDACALYFKSLAFICAGHERFKRYWEARKMRSVDYEISAELNESECYVRLQLGPC